MSEPTQIKLTLHPDAVVAPVLRTVERSVEIVSFHMQSLDKADLSSAPEYETSLLQMKFAGNRLSADERKVGFQNWMLLKGFQDLARGVRGMLEQAYFYVKMKDYLVKGGAQLTTWGALDETMKEYRKQAESLVFPDLMGAVNRGLSSPLHFEKEFLSLQKVRNCLEHRDGVVGEGDVDKDNKLLKLFLPQLRIYGDKDGKQTPLGKGSFVEADSKIVLKHEIKEREFRLGERVSFRPEEFHDIGFGCWAFANDLGSKLPKIEAAAEEPEQAVEPQQGANSIASKSSKPNKSNKLKARLPRGLADRGSADIAATRRMTDAIRDVYERYGFEPVETPAIEYTDALGKFLPDQDRPNEGVFSFQDDDAQWLSLRYDLTAPLARYVAENFDALPKPYRSYRFGWVFRNEKPGPGRFRQFMQFDADTVGAASMTADAEMCMMAADTMEALGIARGSYVVKVNNRKVLDGVMEAIGIGGEENAARRLIVLRALDKYDRLGKQGVRELLGGGRKDESGDFAEGAGLDENQIKRLIWFLTLRTEPLGIVEGTQGRFNPLIVMKPEGGEPYETDLLSAFDKAYGASAMFHEGIEEFRAIEKLVAGTHYDGKIIVDPSVVRGLEYYTGPVYEVELLIETKDEKGRPVRFGSVGGGGRYDGLVSRFRGEPVPATGFSIGVSRLQAALTMIGKLDGKSAPGPVVVTVFDRDRTADYQKMVSALRNAGIRAELYLGNPKNFGNQFKYADKRGSPCVVIQGGDEKAKGEVQIKDLVLGAEIAGLSKERDDYLKKQAEAQFAVAEDKLVEAVRDLLARRGVTWN